MLLARIVVLLIIYLELRRCVSLDELCDNEMSFIMMPQLSIVKTRFAKAPLRARCARHRSWGATCPLPNDSVGYSASPFMRWTLSFPMVTWVVELPN